MEDNNAGGTPPPRDFTAVWDEIAARLGVSKTRLCQAAGLNETTFAQLKARAKRHPGTNIGSEAIHRILSAFPQVNANYVFGTSDAVLHEDRATMGQHGRDALLQTIAIQADRIRELEGLLKEQEKANG